MLELFTSQKDECDIGRVILARAIYTCSNFSQTMQDESDVGHVIPCKASMDCMVDMDLRRKYQEL